MPDRPQPRYVEQGSALTRIWHRIFGPKYKPDVLLHSEEKSRQEAEGMMRLGDEGQIADETVEAVDKLPHNKKSVERARVKPS